MKLLRIIISIIHLIVIGCMMPIFFNRFVFLSWSNLSALFFPFLMIMNVFLIMIWVAFWRKRAFVFIIISSIFFNTTIRWLNYNESSQGTIKVLTYNAKSGLKDHLGVQDFLENKKHYDVIFLQEYQKNINLNNVANNGSTKIITPHKILKQENLLPNTDLANAFYADIEIEGRVMRCINVYLEPFRLEKSMVRPTNDIDINASKASRLIQRLIPVFRTHKRQVEIIRKAIDASPYPVLLAGDLNAVPNSYEYFTLSKNLLDVFVEKGTGSATSFHDYKIPIRIDYIFSSKAFRPTNYNIHREVNASDHFPVTAELDWY